MPAQRPLSRPDAGPAATPQSGATMFSYAGSFDEAIGGEESLPEGPREKRDQASGDAQPGENTWLSIDAACKLLGVDQSTLRRWSDSGKIPVFRTPGGHRRYNEEDLR